ncbi:hypothetical protein HDU67_006363, partial [Dinochytrium kinnereticum]
MATGWLVLNPVVENLERHDHTHLTYDPSREQILVVDPAQGIVVYSITSKPASSERLLSTPSNKGNIRHVKLSPSDTHIGLVSSAKTIDIYAVKDDTLNVVNSVFKDAKSSDVILGFEWTYHNEFIIISRTAVDFYSMSKSRKIFVYRKSIFLNINWYIYSPEHKFLILSSGAGPLYLFYIKKDYKVLQLPSLDILGKNIQKTGSGVLRKNLFLLSIYDRIYCAFIDVGEKESSLLLYRISSKSSHKLEYTINLEKPGPFLISEVDNLIIVHSLYAKTSAIYDITGSLSPNQSKILPYREIDTFGTHKSDFYLESWQPFSPDFILSPSSGTFYQICLNLHDIVSDLRIQSKWNDLRILEFLFRRSNRAASQLAVRVIRGMIQGRAPLGTVRAAFALVNENAGPLNASAGIGLSRSNSTSSVTSLSRTPHSRTSSPVRRRSSSKKRPLVFLGGGGGSSLALPESSSASTSASASPVPPETGDLAAGSVGLEDMYLFVFKPLAEDKAVPTRYLQSCLTEFIASTSTRNLPTLSLHAELLATLLLKSNHMAELQQFLSSGVIPASAGVAMLLIHAGREDGGGGVREDVMEMGMAMLGRLGMHEELVEVLIQEGRRCMGKVVSWFFPLTDDCSSPTIFLFILIGTNLPLTPTQPLEALHHAIQTSTLPSTNPTQLLEVSYNSTDTTHFLNVFKELEDRDLIPAVASIHSDMDPMASSVLSSESCEDGVVGNLM